VSELDLAWTAISPSGQQGLGRVLVHSAGGLTPNDLRGMAAAAFRAAIAASSGPDGVEGLMERELRGLLPAGSHLKSLRVEALAAVAGGGPREPGVLARLTSGLAGALFKLAGAVLVLALGVGLVAAGVHFIRERWSAPSEADAAQAGTHYSTGLELLSRGAHSAAVEELNRALELSPTDARAREARGRALLNMGEYGRARADLDAALDAKPAEEVRLGLLVLRSEARLLSKDPGGALADAKEVLAKRPKHLDAAWHGARALVILKRPKEALPWLDLVVTERPENNAARFRRGLARHHHGDFEGAIDDYEKVILALPKHRLAKRNLSRANQGEGPE
jgi:tetratricopeptide (TPR) repeat protein